MYRMVDGKFFSKKYQIISRSFLILVCRLEPFLSNFEKANFRYFWAFQANQNLRTLESTSSKFLRVR